jgi:hypothetical protein
MTTSIYITVTDPTGGIYMGDNSPVPVNHRILFENNSFHGYESIVKLFHVPGESQQRTMYHLTNFLTLALSQPSGQLGRFTWEHK